jgi:predicted GH43/DUF377 family glycosyl hydrolase
MNEPVVKRFKNNPILIKDQVPYKVETVHNAGVVKHDGRYVMLFRSHLQNGRSIIGIAESEDGFSFSVRKEPFLVKRVALISQPDMRNAVIFPEKIDGRYVRLDRPHSEISPWSICISYSPDLIHWGDSKVVIKPVPYHWDQMKIGPGATPFRTDKGWLNIYHGVFETMAGAVYRLGVALHDYDNPAIVLGVSDDWILEPQDPWERTGYVPNVVFTCGAVPEEDGTVKIYWGGADTVMCAGTARIADLVKMCLEKSRPAY